MFKNYLSIAIRNLLKYKLYSAINIIGLAVGLACCLLIVMYVQDELSYDQFHEDKDQIYRVTTTFANGNHWSVPSYPVGPVLREGYPEIVTSCRFTNNSSIVLEFDDEVIIQKDFIFADPEILDVFTLPFLLGDPTTALDAPDGIVFSEETAQRLFGSIKVLGKSIVLREDTIFRTYQVTGILKEIPNQSMLEIQAMISFENAKVFGHNTDNWQNWGPHTFIKTVAGVTGKELEPKITDVIHENSDAGEETLIHLQPLDKIHLYELDGEDGPITYVYIFSIIAIFILIIACINFMNLTTARSMIRAKEIGLRKVVGARRQDLIFQFYGESLIIAFIAAGMSILFVELLLPTFNEIAQKELTLNLIQNNMGIYLVGITLLTGLIAGSYPALQLSAYLPVTVLKGAFARSSEGSLLRKTLVITQFALSIILIICTLIIQDQLDFVREKNLGFDREHVVYLENTGDLITQYPAIKADLMKRPEIQSVTASSSLPTLIYTHGGIPEYEGRDLNKQMDFLFCMVEFDFLETYKMEVLEGRSFSKNHPSDMGGSYILNEEAVKQMELDDPIGLQVSFWGNKGTVIGVVKDFHYQSMRESIEPIILVMNETYLNYVGIRIQPGNVKGALAVIQNTWEDHMGNIPFSYHFVDEGMDEIYQDEDATAKVLSYFSYLAIFISCLGLLGLATFIAEQRRKEISVRKVLGASFGDVVGMLTKDFTWPVMVAFLVAAPVSFLLMRRWMEGFVYKTDIGWQVFFIAGAMAFGVAWITVGYQSLRAAQENPANALRNE